MPSGMGEPLDVYEDERRFTAALDDDLNTPVAVETVLEVARAIQEAAQQGRDVRLAQEALHRMAAVLGLRLS